MRILTLNIRGNNGVGRARRGRLIDAIAALEPDVVALQEVAWRGGLHDDLARRLAERGWAHAAYSGDVGSRDKRYGNLIAARWPVQAAAPSWVEGVPWPQSLLRAQMEHPDGAFDVIAAHIPNGSSNGCPSDGFASASWLMGQFVTEPGSLGRVLLAVAVTVIALVICAPLAITGYYAWTGYRWTRVSGLIGAAVSFGALTLVPSAWAAIPLAAVAAGLLWLPAATRYFAAWTARRHPAEVFAPPTTDVYYGPLPRYR